MSEAVIEIGNLSKTYGTGENAVRALSGVQLRIERGEIFGVIGLSGAGKSTLVRCINLLEKPTEGTVRVLGQELTELLPTELRAARRKIGMIFQQFNLLMQKTALDNVCFPLRIAGESREQARTRARELLGLVGLSDKEAAYPAQLSGGQKQRVAIARALATNPEILLCDEATSALDPTTTRALLGLLKQINLKLGVTIVVITHEMRVIEEICSRVAIIDESRIAEVGSVHEVFRHPKSEIAKRLVLREGARDEQTFAPGSYRIVFNGEEAFRPVISELVLLTGKPVNILFADTKVIDGRVYGQMIVRLPEEREAADKMLRRLSELQIRCEEVEN